MKRDGCRASRCASFQISIFGNARTSGKTSGFGHHQRRATARTNAPDTNPWACNPHNCTGTWEKRKCDWKLLKTAQCWGEGCGHGSGSETGFRGQLGWYATLSENMRGAKLTCMNYIQPRTVPIRLRVEPNLRHRAHHAQNGLRASRHRYGPQCDGRAEAGLTRLDEYLFTQWLPPVRSSAGGASDPIGASIDCLAFCSVQKDRTKIDAPFAARLHRRL